MGILVLAVLDTMILEPLLAAVVTIPAVLVLVPIGDRMLVDPVTLLCYVLF